MWLLNDITIYTENTKLEDISANSDFRLNANFISDYYHSRLDGYKPPKTGRICLILHPLSQQHIGKQIIYTGAICQIYVPIDEQKYLHLSDHERYAYLLEILHSACIQAGGHLQWDKTIFKKAYESIISDKFVFSKTYESRLNRNRKYSARVLIRKTRELSKLYCQILSCDNTLISESLLIEKQNWSCNDPIYKVALTAKWFNNCEYGISVPEATESVVREISFSVENNEVVNRIVPRRRNHLKPSMLWNSNAG